MKRIDLTKGKVISVLTALAIPIMGSSLLQFTYNLIDMLWVGRLGSNAVASIGSSSFYIGLGYSINALVIIGCGIKVAHAIGEKDDRKIKEYINAGFFINLIIGFIFMVSIIFLGKNFINYLNLNNPIVERDSYTYLLISGPTMLIAFFNLLYARILGSFGNNKLAFNINAIGIIINIILDPILIYTFKLGVLGAALATLVANIVMLYIYIFRCKEILKYNFKYKLDYKKVIEIVKLGFPMSLQRVLFTIINIILARIISRFGTDAIAAQKIGLQIESITYMVVGGLNGAISSFTGQNFGAKKYNRINEGYNTALKIGIIYSFIMTVLFLFFNIPIIKLFIRDEATIIISSSYLKIIAFSQIFSTIEMVSNGLFTGVGKPKIPAMISIVFTVLRIPMALIFIEKFGLNGVWISIALSSILKGIMAYLLYMLKVRKEFRDVKVY
ncbi:MATE family efflux transporter [Clostridium botulinum]|uniref:MATE family efflux transporter n=1 Tax=Clostridium botulinum TaxID=1491 RepID=UPI00036BC4EB|nr:MATE family efflux transporter [Clostridium botulinum]MBN1035322.1 MATE family efflux transporter [Clostridium botulinum]MBN1077526.1 MATE family efflux transporter [Clostridium botulinum]